MEVMASKNYSYVFMWENKKKIFLLSDDRINFINWKLKYSVQYVLLRNTEWKITKDVDNEKLHACHKVNCFKYNLAKIHCFTFLIKNNYIYC